MIRVGILLAAIVAAGCVVIGIVGCRSSGPPTRASGGPSAAEPASFESAEPTPISLEITKTACVNADTSLQHLHPFEAAALTEIMSPVDVALTPSIGHVVYTISRPEDVGMLLSALLTCDQALDSSTPAASDLGMLGGVIRSWANARGQSSPATGTLRELRRAVGRYYASVTPSERYQQLPRMILASALQDREQWNPAAAELRLVVAQLPEDDPLVLLVTTRLVMCLQRVGRSDEARRYAQAASRRFDGFGRYPEYRGPLLYLRQVGDNEADS